MKDNYRQEMRWYHWVGTALVLAFLLLALYAIDGEAAGRECLLDAGGMVYIDTAHGGRGASENVDWYCFEPDVTVEVCQYDAPSKDEVRLWVSDASHYGFTIHAKFKPSAGNPPGLWVCWSLN